VRPREAEHGTVALVGTVSAERDEQRVAGRAGAASLLPHLIRQPLYVEGGVAALGFRRVHAGDGGDVLRAGCLDPGHEAMLSHPAGPTHSRLGPRLPVGGGVDLHNSRIADWGWMVADNSRIADWGWMVADNSRIADWGLAAADWRAGRRGGLVRRHAGPGG
jgi:hypothetical protein